MKRMLSLVLISLMVLGMWAGVASAGGETVELTLWHYYEEGSSFVQNLQKILDGYHERNPNVVIKQVAKQFSDFKQELTIGTVTEALPDIVYIDNCDTVAFAAMGIFADLTDAFADNQDLDDYFDGIMECCMYEGKLYAVPGMTNNMGFYYNKAMFEEAGITELPTNRAELREAVKACTTPERYGFAMCLFGDEAGTFNYLMHQMQAGGDYYTLNNEAGISSLAYLKSLLDDGSMSKDVISYSQRDVGRQFTSQNVAVIQLGCWYIKEWAETVDFEFGTFQISDKQHGNVFGGENMAAINNDRKDYSIDFLKYFMEYDVNKAWNIDASHFAARSASLTDPDYQEDPNWAPYIEDIPFTSARPADVKWPDISLGYQHAFTAVITGVETPEEAAANGQAIIDAAR